MSKNEWCITHRAGPKGGIGSSQYTLFPIQGWKVQALDVDYKRSKKAQ